MRSLRLPDQRRIHDRSIAGDDYCHRMTTCRQRVAQRADHVRESAVLMYGYISLAAWIILMLPRYVCWGMVPDESVGA